MTELPATTPYEPPKELDGPRLVFMTMHPAAMVELWRSDPAAEPATPDLIEQMLQSGAEFAEGRDRFGMPMWVRLDNVAVVKLYDGSLDQARPTAPDPASAQYL